MSANIQYNTIVKYLVTAVCKEPMHVGSGLGDKENVLVHPVDNMPFIQATSIAGLFGQYYKNNYIDSYDDLFGKSEFAENENSSDYCSRIKFGDGIFVKDESLKLELRPRVSINPKTGSCAESIVKGTDKNAGHKFNMEYIGVGSKFNFPIYIYTNKKGDKIDYIDEFETVFPAVNAGQVQFGGQKSNGCGYIKIEKLRCKIFDMNKDEDRKMWFKEDEIDEYIEKDILECSNTYNAYDIIVEGHTEGDLLVKGISSASNESGKKAPDCENIKNANDDYIIPGSSFKGAIRNQMQNIASYLESKGVKAEDIIGKTFGVKSSKDAKGNLGNIRFYDTIVGNKKENDEIRLSHRIHIDKFTGGVINGSLFTEKNVFGDVRLHITVLNYNAPERTCGLLLMALRDLAIGTMNLGGGYNVGKGFVIVDKMEIKKSQGIATIDFSSGKIEDKDKIISHCIDSVIRGTKQ
ncbi:MAG: hypothetical protein IJM37_10650 [Lachnospiraceae bacterium]|nr:hypothetical protein [Lachnospiraceae bacterium]